MKKFILLTLCILLLKVNAFGASDDVRLDIIDGRLEMLYADWDRIKETNNPTENLLSRSWWKTATVEMLQKELQNNSDVNKSDFDGNTLLILATSSNAKPEVVETLIKAGADVNIQNGIGNTALILASSSNNEKLVKVLLENNADTSIENDKEKTAFVYAFFNRNSNIFDMLFKAGANIEEINKHIGNNTILTQVLADNKCSPQFIETIIKTGINPNTYPIDKNPLILAVNRDIGWRVVTKVDVNVPVPFGYNSYRFVPDTWKLDKTDSIIQPDFKDDSRIVIIDMLIKAGADVNKSISSGETPLSSAVCGKKSPSIINLLNQAGATDANALYCAIFHKYDSAIIQSLLKPNLKPQKGLDWSLIEAVKQKKITLVKQLIQNGANVNGFDDEGKTALTYATPTIAKILKENEAYDPMDIFKAIDENDLTKLETLIKSGAKLDIVKELDKNEKMEIEKVFYDIDEVKGLTPLEYAAFTNKPQAVRLLIANGADINEQIKGKKTNKKYRTLLEHIFTSKLQEVFAVFLEKSNINKDYYLWKAIRKGAETPSYMMEYPNIFPALQNIVKAGADVNAKNENGETPLEWLLTHEELKPGGEIEFMAAFLVEHGADTQEIRGKENLLFWSMSKNLYDLAKSLIKAGADVNARDEGGETPLFKAIYNPVIVSMLINAGADVNARDKNGKTPLFKAIYNPIIVTNVIDKDGAPLIAKGNPVIVSMLIKAGADVNAKDKNGISLLKLGSTRPLIYLMLIKAGADVNTKDKFGRTLLWSVFTSGHDYFVYLLVKAGARPDGFDSYDMNRLKEIVDNQHRKFVSMQKQHEPVEYSASQAYCEEDNYCFTWNDLPVNGKITLSANESLTNMYQEIYVKNGKKEMEKFYYPEEDGYKGPLQKKIMYKDGKKDSIEEYSITGKLIQKTSWKDNKKDGPEMLYYENGNLQQEVLFKNGIQDGNAKGYYEDGSLRYEESFIDGKLNGLQKVYHKNGTLKRETAFKNGEKNGIEKLFYENGNLQQEVMFQNKIPAGVSKGYYEDGSIKYEETFINGKLEGIQKVYHANGKLKWEAEYKNGELITKKEFDENGNLKQ